jgi:hypothetical protein
LASIRNTRDPILNSHNCPQSSRCGGIASAVLLNIGINALLDIGRGGLKTFVDRRANAHDCKRAMKPHGAIIEPPQLAEASN